MNFFGKRNQAKSAPPNGALEETMSTQSGPSPRVRSESVEEVNNLVDHMVRGIDGEMDLSWFIKDDEAETEESKAPAPAHGKPARHLLAARQLRARQKAAMARASGPQVIETELTGSPEAEDADQLRLTRLRQEIMADVPAEAAPAEQTAPAEDEEPDFAEAPAMEDTAPEPIAEARAAQPEASPELPTEPDEPDEAVPDQFHEEPEEPAADTGTGQAALWEASPEPTGVADESEPQAVATETPAAPEAVEDEDDSAPEEMIRIPSPSVGRASPRAGRVKTRLLGFEHGSDSGLDPFEAAKKSGEAQAVRFPVGWIIVVEGPGRGAAFTLLAGLSQIGRGADQTVALDFGDTSISRSGHAVVAYDPEQKKFFVGHSGKANIVRLNDRPVLSTEQLTDGDLIRVGETTLRFVALCGDDFDWDSTDTGGGEDAATG